MNKLFKELCVDVRNSSIRFVKSHPHNWKLSHVSNGLSYWLCNCGGAKGVYIIDENTREIEC